MKALVIAAVLFFAIAPAYAQKKTDEQKKADAARQAEQDEAYKSSLKRIPAKEVVSDPWGNVRPGDGNPSSQGGSRKLQPANPAR